MSCPTGSGWKTALDAFSTNIDNQAFVDAFTCLFASTTPGGLLVIGTLVWFGVIAMSYIRSGGSLAMPVVYTLLFGGAVLSQVATPVLGMASVLLLGAFALVVVLVARRTETA